MAGFRLDGGGDRGVGRARWSAPAESWTELRQGGKKGGLWGGFVLCFGCTARHAKLPGPGTGPVPPAGEAQSLSHWTTSKVQDCGLTSAYQSSKKGDLTLAKKGGDTGRTDGNRAGMCDLEWAIWAGIGRGSLRRVHIAQSRGCVVFRQVTFLLDSRVPHLQYGLNHSNNLLRSCENSMRSLRHAETDLGQCLAHSKCP